MRYLSLILLLALCSFQASKKAKDFSKILPGVVVVNENLYFDEKEATNFFWLEYMFYQKQEHGEDSKEYLASYPDTNAWLREMADATAYAQHYYDHPAYREYPVVGVTWKQASDFCAWRTEQVRKNREAQGKADKLPAYFQYRLPTYAEWKMMYDDVANLDDQIGEEGKKSDRGLYRWNMKKAEVEHATVAGTVGDNPDVTAPVKSYWPNKYGVYNIKGNVSEWLLEPNTHTGGSWRTDIKADVTVKQKLEGASASVGFRCVCELAAEAP